MDDSSNSPAYEDLGPHRRSISHDAAPPSRQPLPKTQRLIGELGLRYPPASQADLESHAATLTLLARDLADVTPDLLEEAIDEHVAKSPFMPKASELRAIANRLSQGRGVPDLHAIGARYNERLKGEGRRDIHWIVEHGQLRLESVCMPSVNACPPIQATEAQMIAYGKKVNKARENRKKSTD